MIYTKKLGRRTFLVFYIRKSLNIDFSKGGITDYYVELVPDMSISVAAVEY